MSVNCLLHLTGSQRTPKVLIHFNNNKLRRSHLYICKSVTSKHVFFPCKTVIDSVLFSRLLVNLLNNHVFIFTLSYSKGQNFCYICYDTKSCYLDKLKKDNFHRYKIKNWYLISADCTSLCTQTISQLNFSVNMSCHRALG